MTNFLSKFHLSNSFMITIFLRHINSFYTIYLYNYYNYQALLLLVSSPLRFCQFLFDKSCEYFNAFIKIPLISYQTMLFKIRRYSF